jgi:hypothetical protein
MIVNVILDMASRLRVVVIKNDSLINKSIEECLVENFDDCIDLTINNKSVEKCIRENYRDYYSSLKITVPLTDIKEDKVKKIIMKRLSKVPYIRCLRNKEC